MRTIKLALFGLGTVGTGVARLLTQHREHLCTQSGAIFELKWIVVRDTGKPRPFLPPNARLTNNVREVLDDPEVEIGVELIGGIDPAFDLIRQLLQSGRDVVTANKAVLASRGMELFRIAHETGRTISFEAAVGGGIPIVAAVSENLAANRIIAIAGILNGTSNFVLTAMHDEGLSYADAIRQAQAKGFAEADPTLDIDGTDAAQKLAILGRLAFQSRVDADRIRRRGLDTLSAADVRYASELGYVIKLLAVARATDGQLQLRVAPTLVHKTHPMGQVRGEYNAIIVTGDAVGDTFYFGKGAGMMPTASSVAAGLLDLAVGRGQATFHCLRLWEEKPPGPLFAPEATMASRFYLRYTIDDRPGTLARIAGVLGEYRVSIASVIQHETGEETIGEAVPLVIMTHQADEGAVYRAVRETDRLSIVREPTVCLHVAD